MNQLEMGPENNNAKFKADFANFGIEDQKMVDELMGYGKIADIQISDDSMEISYKTGKREKVVVRKSELRKIDSKSNEVMAKQMAFAIDKNPEKKYVKSTFSKKPSGEQYEQDSAMWG